VVSSHSSAGAVDGVIALVRDASDLATAGLDAEIRTAVDEITGCPNLDGTLELLSERLHEARVFGDHVALAIVILDGLDAMREHHGDTAVDELLVVTSDRLRLPLRRGDVVGMIDAGTFAVIMTGLDDADQLRALTERLVVRVNVDIVADGRLLSVNAFVGAALSGTHSSPTSIIGRATRCAADARQRGASYTPIIAADDAPVG
jgi:diguanylate cyclase